MSIVAKIALVLYLVVLLVTQVFLLAAPGRRIPIYAVLIVLGIVPIFAESRRLRMGAALAVVLGAGLVFVDFYAGQRYDAQMASVKNEISKIGNPAK